MAWFAAAAPYIGAAASIGGTLLSAKGQKDSGKAAAKQSQEAAKNELISAEFEARQAEHLAGQAVAVSHAEAFEQRKMAALMSSRTLALAAASGAGSSDPTVVDIIGNIYAEGAYRSALAMYEGEAEARNLGIAAQARRLSGKSGASASLTQGKSVAKASNMNMFSTILSGAGSFAENYGGLFGGEG
jgi:hypothetical protein